MASLEALKASLQTLLDNGHRVPDGTTTQRIGAHWLKYLEKVHDSELSEAIHRLVLTRHTSTWPTIGAIMSHVQRTKNTQRLEQLDDADEVFGQVIAMVQSRGSYSQPGPEDFDEDVERSLAIFAGVKAAGGWQAICRCNTDDMAPLRASFRAAYRSRRIKSEITGGWDHSRALEDQSTQSHRVAATVRNVLQDMSI